MANYSSDTELYNEGIEIPPAEAEKTGPAFKQKDTYLLQQNVSQKTKEDINNLREWVDVSLDKSKQDTARWLLFGMVSIFCAVTVTAQLVGLFRKEMPADSISTALMDIIKPVIFTLMGFLFGEKAARGHAQNK